MSIKDFLFTAIIVILVVKILLNPHKLPDDNLLKENNKLKDSIFFYQQEVTAFTWLQKANSAQIDSLTKLHNGLKVKYKTIYDTFKVKDSFANSLDVDSIIEFWTKRYNNSKAQ